MKYWVRALGFAVVVGAATAFAAANGGQRVRIDLGVVTFRSVSLPLVVFVSLLVGMLIVVLVGLRADLRMRRRLERYRRALEREEE